MTLNSAEPFHCSFIVPGAPRGKGRPRATARSGYVRMYTDAETRSEEGAIRTLASAAMKGRLPYDGAVEVTVCAYRAIPASFSQRKREAAECGHVLPITKPDADNYQKLCLDALNHIVIRDDSQVVVAHVYKRYSERPRISVEVSAVWPA